MPLVRWVLLVSVTLLTAMLFGAHATAAAPAAADARPGLVFALRTGPEDVTAMSSAFRHARVAKEAGHVGDVTVIVYGRAAVVFDPTFALPAEVRDNLKGARDAGVRIVACETALNKHGIPVEAARLSAEVVPQGIVEITRLVAAGHEVLSY